MQSSWELHNIITYLCYLIYLTSIGNTSSPPLIEWALPDDPQGRWWEWGNNSMYCRYLELAWWRLEYDPLWWKGRFRPTSAQCLQVGIFHFCYTLFSEFGSWILPLQYLYKLFKRSAKKNCCAYHLLIIAWISWQWDKDFWLKNRVYIWTFKREKSVSNSGRT